MSQPVTREYHDKNLRVTFNDGEIQEIKVLGVSECDEHEDCRGIVYDLIASNRPKGEKVGTAFWAEMKDIEKFEVIGDE